MRRLPEGPWWGSWGQLRGIVLHLHSQESTHQCLLRSGKKSNDVITFKPWDKACETKLLGGVMVGQNLIPAGSSL